jgi:hypothetical protein
MKIRNGFVSNSSSSSFCVLGVNIDDPTAERIEKEWEKLKGTGVGVHYAISGGEWKCVGIDVKRMKDDETPRQIKRRLIDALHGIDVHITLDSVDFIEDGGYNG